MKNILFSVLFFVGSTVMAADMKLPAPRDSGGKPVFEAVAARASASSATFPTGKISESELSTLLWAASGKNRASKWTVPFGMGVEPYVAIYVAGGEGVFRYVWADHSLKKIADEDIRAKIGRQSFVASAPYTLIFASDRTSLKNNGRGQENWARWTHVAVGAMTQQLYLVADALGIGARYLQSMDEAAIRKIVNLPQDEEVVCLFPVGKR